MIVSSSKMAVHEASHLLQRICGYLGIAFSANRILPSIADLGPHGGAREEAEELNAIGKQLGIRFREMTGSMVELVNTVNDSGPILLRPSVSDVTDEDNSILVLQVQSRNRLLIHQHGADQLKSVSWLQNQLMVNSESQFDWLLIQPLLAAESASRYHYQTGTTSEPLKPLRRLFALLKPEATDIRNIIIFSVVVGLLSLTLPLAVEAVVNTIAFGKYLQPLIVLCLIVLVFLGFRAGLSVLMTIVAEVIQRKLFVRTVEDLSYRLTRVPLSTWQKYHGPELVNRFFDIVTVQKVSAKLLLDTLMLGLQTVIGLSVLAFYHPFLLGYDIGLLAMMTIILYFIGRGAVKTATDESQLKYETAAWLQEIVRHPSTFKFNGGLGYAINRADELAAKYIHHRQDHFRILLRQISFAMVMQVVAATVLLALGGYLVIERQMTLGQLVAAELIVTVILGSFAKVGKDLESFYDLMASVDKLGKLFDLPVEPANKLQLAWQPGAYSLELVDFQQGHGTTPANITMDAGKIISLYSPSGLQRRKLVEALVGQIKPDSGHVLLDDFRVDAISAESLQEKVSLIREIELFEGTVDDNLRLGRANVGSADVNRIVQRLGFSKTIANLPNGFATKLCISGYPLSPDQAARLVIARALITQPGILFIDGLLDRLSDEEVEDLLPQLNSFNETTTIIVATGRRSIAKWAEQCIDMSQTNWNLNKYDD